MITVRNFCFSLFLFFYIIASFSCEKDRQVLFAVYADSAPLFAKSMEALEGTLDFSKPKKLEYWFADSFFVPNSSFDIEYDIMPPLQSADINCQLILKTGEISWQLPVEPGEIRYSLPIDESFDGRFSIELETGAVEETAASVFKISSISFSRRWFGFYTDNTGRFSITPFVYKRNGSYVIDIPPSFRPNPLSAGIEAAPSSALEFAGRRIETFPGTPGIYISPALFFTEGQLVLFGDKMETFILSEMKAPCVFPIPIIADPGVVIKWPREHWRNPDYEIFRWSGFPELLILDFADYAAQDRMLKRLAFFVEKAGFRGRLAHDAEIAHLHGWNAHDYRAEDLARFFDAARKSGFPLLDEERELEKILHNEGIIFEDRGGIAALSGGIISISRESDDNLRYRFLAHEGFHGLFFIDEDFRDFSRRRWEQLSAQAKRFIISFFDFQQYDTSDEYLLINEFMAHVLQQSASQAADYFGRVLPARLESTWRVQSIPQKDEASGAWPDLASAFAAEAQAFSGYVNRRWSLAAGRVWTLRVN